MKKPYVFKFSHAFPTPVAHTFTADEDGLGHTGCCTHYIDTLQPNIHCMEVRFSLVLRLLLEVGSDDE